MPTFSACPSPAPEVEPTDTFEIDDPIDVFRFDDLREVNADYTATSELCYWCHRNLDNGRGMRDAQGRPVSPWDLWRGSIMANSARDPFFRATVAAEQASLPQDAQDISSECMACHAPAAFAEATLAGEPAPSMDVLSGNDDLALLARDGGTCVGCHLLDPSKAGDEDTWSGHHAYNADRVMYGPHTAPNARPMQNFAQFTPSHHENATEAGMCASCHMLQTEAVDAAGAKTGHVLTEQAPFVEWRSSVFNPERGDAQAQTCQDCHLPTVDIDGNLIETRIAGGLNVGSIADRAPYGRHLLVGGNAFVLQVLYDNRWDLGIGGNGDPILAAIEATRQSLAQSARIDVGAGRVTGGRLKLPVTVFNEVGHKLPTGYPARRAWLEIKVTDATGKTVSHVGATDDRGRLLNASGQPLASELPHGPLQAHRSLVQEPEQVVVWQSWMQTADQVPTTRLLRGATYAKDTRLLPKGWNPSASDAPLVASVGTDQDPDFIAGSDSLQVDLPITGSPPYTVDLTVRYQAFSPRFLDELFEVRTLETASLELLIEDRGIPAESMAQVSIQVP